MDNKNYRLAAYKAAVEDVSELWCSFETVGIDEATDCTTEPWNGFEVGTPRAKLVSWFAGAYGAWIEDPLVVKDVPGLKQEDLPAAHKIWDEYCGVDTDAVMHPDSLTAATTVVPKYLYLAIVYYCSTHRWVQRPLPHTRKHAHMPTSWPMRNFVLIRRKTAGTRSWSIVLVRFR